MSAGTSLVGRKAFLLTSDTQGSAIRRNITDMRGKLSKEKHAIEGERERGRCVGGERGPTAHDHKQDSPRTVAAVGIKIRRGLPCHWKQLSMESKLAVELH